LLHHAYGQPAECGERAHAGHGEVPQLSAVGENVAWGTETGERCHPINGRRPFPLHPLALLRRLKHTPNHTFLHLQTMCPIIAEVRGRGATGRNGSSTARRTNYYWVGLLILGTGEAGSGDGTGQILSRLPRKASTTGTLASCHCVYTVTICSLEL
jgi:hypothetical protein